jgi:DNA repair exonuclease SbcCD nuclease subunit
VSADASPATHTYLYNLQGFIMKIAVASDCHLEFGPISLENTENADVLILSGDICVVRDFSNDKKSIVLHKFFKECSERFRHVLYVAGNHEHYNGDFANTYRDIRLHLLHLGNVHVLDKELIIIDGIGFIGGTLWTDMNKEDPITLSHIRGYMNDFRIIKNSNTKVNFRDSDGKFHHRDSTFTPEDAVEDHKAMMQFIKTTIDSNPNLPFVVVGHHAPCKLSVKPRYKDDHIVNGAYSSDLSEFILDNPRIKLWTHGHTHDEFDYVIGSTRIVCNPRGYDGYEDRADKFKLKFVEI